MFLKNKKNYFVPMENFQRLFSDSFKNIYGLRYFFYMELSTNWCFLYCLHYLLNSSLQSLHPLYSCGNLEAYIKVCSIVVLPIWRVLLLFLPFPKRMKVRPLWRSLLGEPLYQKDSLRHALQHPCHL